MECIEEQQQNNDTIKDQPTDGSVTMEHTEPDGNNGGEDDSTVLPDAEEGRHSNINDSEKVIDIDDDDDSMDDDALLSTRKGSRIILSDDDDDESNPPITSHSTDTKNDDSSTQRKMRIIIDSDSDEDSSLFPKPDPGKQKDVYNRDIFDTELSDEDQPPPRTLSKSPSAFQDSDEEVSQKNKKKVKKSKKSSSKPEDELREIRSESQRLVRESRISLPYHRPKQRTLAEFLARRKPTLPPKTEKQSLTETMKNMEILKSLEDKQKEVEKFYKSDSDLDDPDDQEWTPDKEDKEEVQWSANTKPSGSNVDPQDSSTVIKESKQQVESNESRLESHTVTHQTVVSSEDEGLGPSVINSFSESSPSDMSPSEDKKDKNNEENSLQVTEVIDSKEETVESEGLKTDNSEQVIVSREALKLIDSKDETVESEGVQTDCNAQITVNREESCNAQVIVSREESLSEGTTLSNESPSITRPDTHESDLSNSCSSNSMFKFTTPKLRLLASKLPEEELNRILSVTPRLNAGKKQEFIDLNECPSSRESGLNELKTRFQRHVDIKLKPKEKQQMNLNIVSKEDDGSGGERLVSSVLPVTVTPKEDPVIGESASRSSFTSIKAALQAKIRQKRELNRMKRVQEKQFMETEELPEDEQNYDDLPNEEVELTDQSETDCETESEPEENDVVITDKKREKSAYVDDEAEEDEEEEEEEEKEVVEDEEVEGELEAENEDLDDTRSLPSNIEDDNIESTKERRRIIINDSDSEEEAVNDNFTLNMKGTQELQSEVDPGHINRSNTDDLSPSFIGDKGDGLDKDASVTSFDSSFELYGSVIAGHQPRGSMNDLGLKKSGSISRSLSNISMKPQELLLPSEAERSVDMFNNEVTTNAAASPAGPDLNFSSLDCTLPPHESGKEEQQSLKLDLDFTSRIDSTQDQDELLGLCTGQFGAAEEREEPTQSNLYSDQVSSTQDMNDLLGLCTGHFSGIKEGHPKNTQTAPETLPISQEEHDDDEILGLCTAKFTASANSLTKAVQEETQSVKPVNDEERVTSPKLIIYSSGDEDTTVLKSRIVKRKKRKRTLEFSDDEDAQEPLAFDDDENEMAPTVFSGFKDNARGGGIRAEFLEKEAELSGSDFNSDDEGEDSFDDDMEEEEGDREQFDSNELRDQVGKAHLKSLLDSDKREVRLLQEMYLEDGELHGEGRSRQFRWKNLDKRFEDDERRTLSDEEGGSDEDVDNTQWRMEKVQREKFMQEQRAKMKDEEADLYEVSSWSSASKDGFGKRKPLIPIPPPRDSNSNSSFSLMGFKKQRGSFLNRDKNTLARIAEFTRDRKDVVGGAKQGGNFVFQHLGDDAQQDKEEEDEEEKVATPSQSQRKRDTLKPSLKKAKIDHFSLTRDESQSSSSIFEFL